MNKRTIILSAVIMVMVFLTGCNIPSAPPVSDSQTQVALFAQATLTKFALLQTEGAAATQPEATQISTDTALPTTVPATAIPPTTAPATQVPIVTVVPVTPPPATATSQPLPTSSSYTRISFATGTTNYTVTETIPANTTRRYALRLTQYQMLETTLSSSASAYIAVNTEAGKQLVDFSQNWMWYRDYATENGDWYIDVRTGANAANINLYFMAPQRISFAAGKDSLIAKASVGGGRVFEYVAWANKDQTMKVNLNPASGLVLSVWKVGGDVLLASSAGKSSFEGVLPRAGDYVITVTNPGGPTVDFEMTLTVR